MKQPADLARALRLLAPPLTALALIPILLTELRFFTIHDLVGGSISDTIYLRHAAEGLIQGHRPYGPGFLTAPDSRLVFVYPPLTLLLAVPPLLAGSYYSFGFAVELVLLLGSGLWLLRRWCRRAGVYFPVAFTAGLLLIALGPILVTRLDGVQGLALAGSALALRSRRLALAVALVTLAALVKETVVLAALPILAWALWPPAGTGWTTGLGRRLASVGLGLIPAALVLLTFVVWSSGRVLSAAGASISRGVEVESIPATISYLLHPIFRLSSYAGGLGSEQVAGAQVTWVAALVVAAGLVALVWGTLHFAREGRRPATAIAFATAVGLAATPVLSPQYMLALVPVLVLAAGTEFDWARGRILLLEALLLALLTQAEFPYLFQSVAQLGPVGTAIVAARNVVLIAVAVTLARSVPEPAGDGARSPVATTLA